MRKTATALAIAATVLTGCSKTTETGGPGPIAVRPPKPPNGAPAGLSVPQPGADGRYVTVNSGIGGTEALWHVRAALNVAALGCRGDATIAKGYNQFLGQRKSQLSAAYNDETKRLGTAALDTHSTRLYNFFAQPDVQPGFCKAAAAEIAQLATIAPANLNTQAVTAIARLEAPFTAFYDAYNKYTRELAVWQSKPANRSSLALSSPAGARMAAMPALMAAPLVPTDRTWRAELGLFTGRAAAETAWARAKAATPALSAFTPVYRDLPGQGQTRVEIGAEHDRDGAVRLCAAAAAAGLDCTPGD